MKGQIMIADYYYIHVNNKNISTHMRIVWIISLLSVWRISETNNKKAIKQISMSKTKKKKIITINTY